MSLILNIDTTSGTALVNIAENGIVLQEVLNEEQKDHAAFLQPAIQSISQNTGISLQALDAIAVCHGPGSYTGIRVGMSSAKGLCYALNKPLITISALEVLTKDAISNNVRFIITMPVYYCPLIDARRMEVYTAVYNSDMNLIDGPCALVLNENSFVKMLLNNHMMFFGSGAAKWQRLRVHENAEFVSIKNKGLAMSCLAHEKLQQNYFADIAYSEPLYLKEFYNGTDNS